MISKDQLEASLLRGLLHATPDFRITGDATAFRDTSDEQAGHEPTVRLTEDGVIIVWCNVCSPGDQARLTT